jgi:hypothetical protein
MPGSAVHAASSGDPTLSGVWTVFGRSVRWSDRSRFLPDPFVVIRHHRKEHIKATEKQLQTDLARHAGALQESMSSMITAYDDKYADLPGRVKALETRVFGPK